MSRRMLAVTAVAIGLLGPAVAEAAVPVPTVTGPLPVSEASHPFGGAAYQWVPEDLSKDGYVEEEYFVSGLANVYDWPAAGPAVVRTPNAPYTTRILVRRPQSPARSSGNAIVEMLNPSNNMDLNIGWAIMREHLMRKGDTWIGITIRPIAVDALKRFDPARYAPLSFADPLPAAQRPCTITGAEADQERGLAWDMNSQVGAWIRSNAATNPLRGAISKVYGFGYSQTGGYLNTYANAIHKLATLDSGAPVYDGYFITVAGGGFVGLTAINQCVRGPARRRPAARDRQPRRADHPRDVAVGLRARGSPPGGPTATRRRTRTGTTRSRAWGTRRRSSSTTRRARRTWSRPSARCRRWPATKARAAASRPTSRSTRCCRTSTAGRAPASRRRGPS